MEQPPRPTRRQPKRGARGFGEVPDLFAGEGPPLPGCVWDALGGFIIEASPSKSEGPHRPGGPLEYVNACRVTCGSSSLSCQAAEGNLRSRAILRAKPRVSPNPLLLGMPRSALEKLQRVQSDWCSLDGPAAPPQPAKEAGREGSGRRGSAQPEACGGAQTRGFW